MGKCLLRASREFAEKHKNLLMLFSDRADKFTYINPDGSPKKFKGKVGKKKQLPDDLGAGSGKPSPAGNDVGKVKKSIVRAVRDKKGKPIRRKVNPSGNNPYTVTATEIKNVLPDKLTKKESEIKKKINRENAKIAALTANEAEGARVTVMQKRKTPKRIATDQITKRGAKMEIRTSKPFAKEQGTVLAQTEDPKKFQKPPKKPTEVGKHNLRVSKEREAKELQKNPKTRARKKKFEDLPKNQQQTAIRTVMKQKGLNYRGALTWLRKNPLYKIFLRKG